MKLAIVLVILVIGTVAFHFLSPWWFTPLASNWGDIDNTITITFWVTGFVFVAVNLFVAYAIYRFRYQKNRRSHYEPENKKLEAWLTGITAVGVAAMLAPGLMVWAQFVHVPENAALVEVVGQQWNWSFRFPGADGKFGKTDNSLIDDTNPFGIHSADQYSQDDILVASSELHLPANQPVKLLLRSKDVLHDFAVPQFRVKMDLIPGSVTYFWFTPTREGVFDILCQELCGIAHHAMRGKVVVETEDKYQQWLKTFPTFADTQKELNIDLAQGEATYAMCSACHGKKGEGNKALNAPALANQNNWYLKRQLQYFKNGQRGYHKDDVYGKQMAPLANMVADEKALNNLSAYLHKMEKPITQPTINGDLENGRWLYQTCATCHGDKAQGNYGLNAPKLAGQADWYLKRQILNYQKGIRGKHSQDSFGAQMMLMAGVLKGSSEIDDVVAYISTL